MTIKVGVFANGQMSGNVVSEAQEALRGIAMKYNCRFELSSEEEVEEKKMAFESNLNANLKTGSNSKDGVFLSFGGELEF